MQRPAGPRFRPVLPGFLASLLLIAFAALPVRAEPTMADRADRLLSSFVRAGAFQGVALLAVDGEVVFEKAYGKASVELDVDNTPETRFHIASVSKPFTAAAILLLVERGLLDLHAPLTDVLPEYPGGEKLTLDHLLTHTSGIPNINSFQDYERWSREPQTTESLVEKFQDEPLQFPPGERYSYSNSNYNLLARVIEKVSGKPFGRFLNDNIFRPLGMKDTFHHSDMTAIVPRLAVGYTPEGARGMRRAPYLDWTIKTGNGSLVTTARDLLAFDRGLRSGFLGEESLQTMYGLDRGLGYGWFPGEEWGEREVHISGRSPGYTAYFFRFVDLDRCFVLVSNLYASQPSVLTSGLAAILLGREPEDFELAPAAGSPDLSAFAGIYSFGEDWFAPGVKARIEDREDYLRVVYVEGSNLGYEFVLVPVGDRTFYDRNHGGMVRFEREEKETPWTLVYTYGNGEWRAPEAP